MDKVLMLDNYDSFSYILVGYINELLHTEIDVKRNDELELDEIEIYDTIILSPGPGLPEEAGIMPEILKRFASSKKILGICLGHQAIIQNFGGNIKNLDKVFHGVASEMTIQVESELLKQSIFRDIPKKFKAGRYHSWSATATDVSDELLITALDETGEVMAVQHKNYPVHGVQFHPESIMTPFGKKIIANFLEIEYDKLPHDFPL